MSEEQLFSDAIEIFLARLETDGVDEVNIDVIRTRWLPEILVLEQAEAEKDVLLEIALQIAIRAWNGGMRTFRDKLRLVIARIDLERIKPWLSEGEIEKAVLRGLKEARVLNEER